MLQKLLDCTDLDGITTFGAELLKDSAMVELQTDIQKARFIFNQDSYWERDKLSLYSAKELIEEANTEDTEQRVLHLLQLIKMFCPAIESPLTKLLKRATC